MHDSINQLLLLFNLKLPEALLKFQFIEEALRMYIAGCYQIISLKVYGQIPFNYDYTDLQKDALGTLLKKFKRFNNNALLAEKIESIIKDRNYCAHQAFLLTHEGQKDSDYITNGITKMDMVITKAEECRQLIFSELKQLEAIKNHLGEYSQS